MRIKCKSDYGALPPHEYYICFSLTVPHFSRQLCFNAILNSGSLSASSLFFHLENIPPRRFSEFFFFFQSFKCVPVVQTGEYLLGWSRVKAIVPRWVFFFFFSPLFFYAMQCTVPLCGHPEWCGCKGAWTEFFIIGLWDFQSLSSNQVHMPIVMDSTLEPLCPRQHTHTNQNLHARVFLDQ